MWWLVDHGNLIYLMLLLAVLIQATLFWLNRRVKHLVGLGVVLILAALFWLMCRFVVTDRKQLEIDIRTMAQATLDHDAAKLLRHLAQDFDFRGKKRDDVAQSVVRTSRAAGVTNFHIWEFSVDELSRAKKTAKVSFRLRVDAFREGAFLCLCRGTFVLENDRWLLKTFDVFQPVSNTDQPIHVPLQ